MHYALRALVLTTVLASVAWSRRLQVDDANKFDDRPAMHAHAREDTEEQAIVSTWQFLSKLLLAHVSGRKTALVSSREASVPLMKIKGRLPTTKTKRSRDSARRAGNRRLTKKERSAIRAVENAYLADPASIVRKEQPCRYYCICDFEATCAAGVKYPDYVHEIIEFPVVLIEVSDEEERIVEEFHTFVRPSRNVTLTTFCSQLTGITQDQVDLAPTLAEALALFDEWRIARGLHYSSSKSRNFMFVFDGVWDMKFLRMGCYLTNIEVPTYFEDYCNIKEVFRDIVPRSNYRQRTIDSMLKYFSLEAEGRRHSGIDDSRDIARIAMNLIRRGAMLYANFE